MRTQFLWMAVCILTLSAAFACSSVADNRRNPKLPDPEKMMAVLKERLHLTQEQESQVFPIVEDAAKERQAIIQRCREDPMSNAATLRNELIKLRERTEKKLTPILSHEQMNEYWRFLTEMPQRSGSREGRPGGRRPGRSNLI